MTEFAIVLPVLAFVLFAILQFGIVLNNYITLTDAVRSGGRTASVSRTASDPVAVTVARVKSSAANLNQTGSCSTALCVTVATPNGWTPGKDVTVTATYPFSISLFGLVVKSGNLSSSVTERIE
jgi:Flp pilus assembly protein TadG